MKQQVSTLTMESSVSAPDAGAEEEKRQPQPEAELIIYPPAGGVVVRWTLSDQEVTIGRAPSSDIQLEGRRVSRQHARLIRTASGHRIVDLNSTNGVRKGGVRGSSWDLQFGDEVELGDYRVAYVVSGEDPDRTTPDQDTGATEGRLRVDEQSRAVWRGEQRLERSLSRLEFKLLAFLYARAGRVCERQELGEAVWGEGNFEDVMVHQLVYRLREKLTDNSGQPRYLVNLPGQGYRLDP